MDSRKAERLHQQQKVNLPPIRHFLKDGTEIKGISGMKIAKPHPVYDVLARLERRTHEKAE